jgi:hypothetical protein
MELSNVEQDRILAFPPALKSSTMSFDIVIGSPNSIPTRDLNRCAWE